MSVCCETCRFGVALDAHERVVIECRRLPPRAMPGRMTSRFPWLEVSDWCGEFQPKPPGPSAETEQFVKAALERVRRGPSAPEEA